MKAGPCWWNGCHIRWWRHDDSGLATYMDFTMQYLCGHFFLCTLWRWASLPILRRQEWERKASGYDDVLHLPQGHTIEYKNLIFTCVASEESQIKNWQFLEICLGILMIPVKLGARAILYKEFVFAVSFWPPSQPASNDFNLVLLGILVSDLQTSLFHPFLKG